jgi:prophage maintenance system killer protein
MLMDIFLQKNGWEIAVIEEKAYSLVMELAGGKLSKAHLARWLREYSARLDR